MTGFEKLIQQSPMARHYQQLEYDIETILDVSDYHPFGKALTRLDFHPNGISGCILDDENHSFDIKCDHLMWLEGFVEDVYNYELSGETGYVEYGYTKGEIDSAGISIGSAGNYPIDSKIEFDYPNNTFMGAFPVILLIGNHKGATIMKLIRFRLS